MTEQRDDATLEALFGAARQQGDALPDDLLARIMADATAEHSARAKPPTAMVRPGWLVALGAMLGGWPSVAGLATAALAGVWIGVAQPTALNGFGFATGAAAEAFELDDLMPGLDVLAYGG